jgi:ATP-dependent protease HslVU (ClpYQ) peptidase subunit
MSIAVAVSKDGRTVVAADTQENFGDRKLAHTDHRVMKILQVGSAYLATTGWGLYDNILEDYLSRAGTPRLGTRRDVFSFFLRFWKELGKRYSLVNEQAHQDDPSPFADLDSSFLVVSGGGIFYVSGNLSVSEFERYYAVGSGSSYALGAMHVLYDTDLDAEDIARSGCAAAMTFDLYCGGEIEVSHVAAARTRARGRGAGRK